MSMQDELSAKRVLNGGDDSGLQALCAGLSHTGKIYLDKIAAAINEVAPDPGLLVYVTARKLSIPLNGLDPVLFSAIDATTHLQVAQAYLSLTTAAAWSFIEFAAKSLPFPIIQIRTPVQRPFARLAEPLSTRDFSGLIGRLGCVHSLITDPQGDALLSVTSRLRFGGIEEGSLVCASSLELQRELGQFLFFHNNYRSIPWLEGKTPLQKLKTFERYGSLHSFSPMDAGAGSKPASQKGPAHGSGRRDRTNPHHRVNN